MNPNEMNGVNALESNGMNSNPALQAGGNNTPQIENVVSVADDSSVVEDKKQSEKDTENQLIRSDIFGRLAKKLKHYNKIQKERKK